VRWPAKIAPGESKALLAQIDLPASLASLTGRTLAPADAPDSFNLLDALLGRTHTGRDHLVEHARVLSLIRGHWKYIEPGKGPRVNKNTNTELGIDPQPQLYNLKDDLSEKHNLAAEHPDKVQELAALLEKIKQDRRTRPQ
jgi:arylsulfatase A-like enzyme